MQSTPAIQPLPKYVGEEEVAKITGLSREWFARARRERIGPRWHAIARRIVYPLADLVNWVESGAAGREHLSSRGPKRIKRTKADSSDPMLRAGEPA